MDVFYENPLEFTRSELTEINLVIDICIYLSQILMMKCYFVHVCLYVESLSQLFNEKNFFFFKLGLKAQHLAGIRLIQSFCHARLIGDQVIRMRRRR